MAVTFAVLLLCLSKTAAPGAQEASAADSASPIAKGSVAQSNRLSVAIFGFANKTGDPAAAHWAVALERLLGKELKEVKGLRLLPGTDYALRQLNKKVGDPLDADQAQLLGELIEARRVVWGDYQRQGKQWLVTARVLNVGTGRMLSEFKVASADWFKTRDLLVKRILKELNVHPTKAERRKLGQRWTSAPATLEWLCQVGQMELEHKSEAEVEKCARRAVEADPQCAEARVVLAAALYIQGKLEEAEEAARKAVALKRDYAQGQMMLGVVLSFRGKEDEAEKVLLTAGRLDPEEAATFERLGELYSHRDQKALASANFNKALAVNRFSSSSHAHLGLLYAEQGDREKALPELREAERLALPEDIGAEQFLSKGYEALREVPPAIAHYQQFIALAKKVGANPEVVKTFERHLRELKDRLAPVYVTAARPQDYTEQTLAEALGQKLNQAELLLVINPFASTSEMNRWAQKVTAKATNDFQKALLLYDSLARRLNPGLVYKSTPRTAQEVFRAWDTPGISFSCSEHACLYVALARAAGLRAYFVSVDEEADGEKVLHACAGVFFGDKMLLADPAYFWFGAPHKKYTLLDDFHAIASRLAECDVAQRRIASKLVPDSAKAQLNLGGALMHAGEQEEARKAFLAVLRLEPEGAPGNIAHTLLAFQDHKVDEAVAFAQKACEANPDDGAIRVLLGLAYKKQGKLREARAALRDGLRRQLHEESANAARKAIAEINEAIGNE